MAAQMKARCALLDRTEQPTCPAEILKNELSIGHLQLIPDAIKLAQKRVCRSTRLSRKNLVKDPVAVPVKGLGQQGDFLVTQDLALDTNKQPLSDAV